MANRVKRTDGIKAKILEYLAEHPCVECGFDHPAALDFDHVGTKTKSVCKMVVDGYSWQAILDEIEQCQVLCANHHRIKTAKDFGWYSNI